MYARYVIFIALTSKKFENKLFSSFWRVESGNQQLDTAYVDLLRNLIRQAEAYWISRKTPVVFCNRQRSRRIDMYEIIVLERSGTFQHYFVRGVLQ